MTTTQSVVFPKSMFTEKEAVEWLKKHDYVGVEVDEKPNYLRFRQYDPKEGERYRTVMLPNHIQLVLAIRGKKNE